MSVFVVNLWFSISVRQGHFLTHLQVVDTPSADKLNCAMQCMITYPSRVFQTLVSIFVLNLWFPISVRQGHFLTHLQVVNTPSADKLNCAMKCMMTYRCRAFKVDQDQSGNYFCTTFNETDTLVTVPVFVRLYPVPTTEGKCLTVITNHEYKYPIINLPNSKPVLPSAAQTRYSTGLTIYTCIVLTLKGD